MVRVSILISILSATFAYGQIDLQHEAPDTRTLVESRLAELSGVVQSGGLLNPLEKVLVEGFVHTSSHVTVASGGDAQSQLEFTDGLTSVTVLQHLDPESGRWVFDAALVNGSISSGDAVELGTRSNYVNPNGAAIEIQSRILQGGPATQAPADVQELTPLSITPSADGLTIFILADNEGVVILENSGGEVSTLLAAFPPLTKEQIKRKICARLLDWCLHQNNELGVKACEAWLNHCQ